VSEDVFIEEIAAVAADRLDTVILFVKRLLTVRRETPKTPVLRVDTCKKPDVSCAEVMEVVDIKFAAK
jgi:hypothetical protein